MEHVADGRQLLVFLVAAGIVVPLFQHLKLGVVLGFLIAGIIVGPGGFGHLVPLNSLFGYATITDVGQLQAFGDLGILFLLFTIGLELSFARLGSIGRLMLGAGGLQVALATAAIYATAALTGFEFDDSLVFGMAFALSSTAIVTQSLAERRRLGTPVGRTALGVLILQDLMVVPIVIVVGILAQPGASVGLALVKGVAIAGVVVVAVVLLGRTIVKPLMRFAGATGNRTLLIAITLLIIVVAGFITANAGLSAALGAFLAGLLLSETEYRHQIDVEVEPFKDLLLGLFFMTVGMTIDVAAVLGQLPIILAGLAVLFIVKLAFGYLALRVTKLDRAASVETAFILCGAGEFAFVVFTLAVRDGVVSAEIGRLATTIAAISMVLTPVMGALGSRLAKRLAAHDAEARSGVGSDQPFADHVIIGGPTWRRPVDRTARRPARRSARSRRGWRADIPRGSESHGACRRRPPAPGLPRRRRHRRSAVPASEARRRVGLPHRRDHRRSRRLRPSRAAQLAVRLCDDHQCQPAAGIRRSRHPVPLVHDRP